MFILSVYILGVALCLRAQSAVPVPFDDVVKALMWPVYIIKYALDKINKNR